jgi:enolase
MIKNVSAIEIYDSRGNPTVEVKIELNSGEVAVASVPSGASTGSMEAFEMRDGGSRLGGRGVQKAVDNVNNIIAKELIGMPIDSQLLIDKTLIELDGTQNKRRLGCNAILGCSLAAVKAGAMAKKLPLFQYIGGVSCNMLPVPLMNIINGGVHADNMLDIQEFMIMPVGADSFAGAMTIAGEIFQTLKVMLKQNGLSTNVGDEGGFAPQISSATNALDFILTAIEKSGYKAGKDVLLALDVAASELFNNNLYSVDGEAMDYEALARYYRSLIINYPIFSIEDPMSEHDADGFQMLSNAIGNAVQLVGDDFFVTDSEKITAGVAKNIANAVLIKPNQVGTFSEAVDAIRTTQDCGYQPVISHRSGETEDVTISHIAVGTGSLQIKAGSMCRTDRIAKYNELLRIEHLLSGDAQYAGDKILEKYKQFRVNIDGK